MDATRMQDALVAFGETFLGALAARDFEHIAGLFQPRVRFRALVPSGLREATTAQEATNWLRSWYGDADTFQMQAASIDQIAGWLALAYRIQLRKPEGWRVIEQHAYCDVADGQIADMAVLCSGFQPDAEHEESLGPAAAVEPRFGADAFYDAGDRGCAEGPIDVIASLMRRMAPGKTLEVRATDASVAADLPAWCRLAGNELVKQVGDRYLIRRGEA